jgi:hypothetical protein
MSLNSFWSVRWTCYYVKFTLQKFQEIRLIGATSSFQSQMFLITAPRHQRSVPRQHARWRRAHRIPSLLRHARHRRGERGLSHLSQSTAATSVLYLTHSLACSRIAHPLTRQLEQLVICTIVGTRFSEMAFKNKAKDVTETCRARTRCEMSFQPK